MVGLIAPKSRKENNKKKSTKARPLLVSFPCPTTFRNRDKKNRKRGVEAPPAPPLLAMVGSKTFPLNYTHNSQNKTKQNKKQKRGSRNSLFYLAMVGPRT
jgi:hypothetical protein